LTRGAWVGARMEVAARAGLAVAARLLVPEQRLAEGERPIEIAHDARSRYQLRRHRRDEAGCGHCDQWRRKLRERNLRSQSALLGAESDASGAQPGRLGVAGALAADQHQRRHRDPRHNQPRPRPLQLGKSQPRKSRPRRSQRTSPSQSPEAAPCSEPRRGELAPEDRPRPAAHRRPFRHAVSIPPTTVLAALSLPWVSLAPRRFRWKRTPASPALGGRRWHRQAQIRSRPPRQPDALACISSRFTSRYRSCDCPDRRHRRCADFRHCARQRSVDVLQRQSAAGVSRAQLGR